MDNYFDTLRDQRLTASGKACVELARREYQSANEDASAEARQWVKLALEADKDDLARQLKSLQEKFGSKTKGREAADKLRKRKRAVGDNVVEMPARDGI